ncbi:MAG: aspartate--ammonia ligase [Erysipelotrichaceae bacterium]|nr:aspartate--ammonia ligase [Erysipelotrichaceae bacterium]
MKLPENYHSQLDLLQTEIALKLVKDTFERQLAKHLSLTRVSAPLMVRSTTGLNDNLNGVERPVIFDVPALGGDQLEIVHSLAKWKRMAIKLYGLHRFKGIYTDMNAIRRDEELDNLHSLYVDQWDWEKVIEEEDRTIEFLEGTVDRIMAAIIDTEQVIRENYPQLDIIVKQPDVHYITTTQLYELYPDLTPKERENEITRKYGTVFIMQIGDILPDGKKHDGRAPDYDDWELNGDLLLWSDILETAVEISSMGIRVNRESLLKQLEKAGCMDRVKLPFHKALLNGELPLTMGGGIGQSRLCMLLLNKAHVGEVQASIWPDAMVEECHKKNIELL